ncbi:PREDICTED: protein TIS11 isoform X2 [Nicrophorus vespilloides]|uniref:Protein TIS11 isoform X2 n=1 Tax=Nicrophorus vespilloides TaxID=110193 RepID=A0ABM1M8C8_NICVS|nr:PREDICTED: protein TIS11 isoform X2 [Nicrophorus vespilloides]
MSTAVMSQNAMYEFGDIIIKNNGVPSPESSPGSHLAVGSAAAVRYTLSRMASTPNASATASLVSSILGNFTQQHRRLERTQSAPAPASALPATQGNTSRYKTELCRPYEEFGVCKYGDKCQFAHGIAELRNLARHPKYKTELCRTYHTVGFCPYGPRCHFVHNQEEVMQQTRSSMPTAILAVNRNNRQRPAALSPALSLDSNNSPPCSLSQSPTSSMGSFFSSEPELHSPGVVDDQRLPVFNRLSAPLLTLGELP